MNEEKIVKMYTEESKSTYEVAKMFQTYPNKIRRILIKHGVELKNKSEAQKNALQNGVARIPTKGKKRTKEERLKISQSQKNHWEKIDQKTYDKYVRNAKKRWSKLTDVQKNEMRRLAIQAIRIAGKEGSKLEKFLKSEFTRLGFVVETHKKNLLPNESLEIDLYLPKAKAIIEIDGPSHFIPIWGEEKLRKQIKADANKTGLILSKGFVIIRVKNLLDSIPLATQENLKNRLVSIIEKIQKKFPKKSDRYIEIEL